MNQFSIKLKGRLSVLALLLNAGASAQSPETYAFPWTNTGFLTHGAGTGANAFSVIPAGSYDAFTYGSGTDAFAGPNGVAGNQEIAGTVAPLFGTLEVNNGAGQLLTITNTAGVSIGTNVSFLSGIISNRALGNVAPLAFLSSAAIPAGGTSGSFVDGYVSKTGNTAFKFVVGDLSAAAGEQYHPLGMGAPSGSTTVTTAYVASATPNSSNLSPGVLAVDPGAYWTFNSTNSVTAKVSVLARDESGGPSPQVFLAGYNTTTNQWENVSGGSYTSPSTNQAIASTTITLTDYSAFTIGFLSTTLPVTLINFAATADGCSADLSWQTAMEQNSSHYEIELSTDGAGFTKVAEVKSRNSSTGANYSYQYKALNSKVSYFRLRTVDIDGKATYSPIVSVISNCNVGGKIVVSPNPATDVVNIRGLDDGRNQIILFDINGKKLVELAASGTSQSLPVGIYPKGIYILRVISAGGAIVNVKVQKE